MSAIALRIIRRGDKAAPKPRACRVGSLVLYFSVSVCFICFFTMFVIAVVVIVIIIITVIIIMIMLVF